MGMKYRLMMDSGAFSVWSKGASIDLEAYVEFCHAHPNVAYYVNLDVIPGLPNQKRTLTPEAVERAASTGWFNYRWMLAEGLPKSKVIPVYHQNDDIRWLHRYLEFGTPYVGISPANDNTTETKLRWLDTVKPFLFDGAGRPVVRTHGFAVTSYELMQWMDWWSVDSASWKLSAAWGCVYFPQMSGGEEDYGKSPLVVAVSPMSPAVQKRQAHVESMSPFVKRRLLDYLDSCGTRLGVSDIVQETADYTLSREAGETWYDKASRKVLRIVEPGVSNVLNERLKVNARFVRRSQKELPVRFIYFAGAPIPDQSVEACLGNRLLSFHEMRSPANLRCLSYHESLRTGRLGTVV